MVISEITANLRSKNISKQIVLSLLLKIFAMTLGFAVIPKTINILGSSQYGIWLTILSVVSWIVTFDVGIGNGLRNKLAESLSIGDCKASREYISTAYISLAILGLFLILLCLCVFPFVNWGSVFNTHLVSNRELGNAMYMVTFAVIINFVIAIVNQVMNAFQLAAYTNLLAILHSSLFLLCLLFLHIDHDLYSVTKFYSVSLIISGILVTIVFFRSRQEYIPKLKYFKSSKVKEILKLGGGFFIIQLATVFMFSITSMLIIQLLKSEDVAIYNVTFRLFSVLTLIFSLIVTPYWSAFTEAKKKNDFQWIRKALRRLHFFLAISVLCALFLYFTHQFILNAWLGEMKIVPGSSLAFLMALYSIILNWSNIYSHYLNGVGNLKLQTIIAVFQALIIIPLCLLFTKYFDFGLFGIMLGMIICILPFAIIGPIVTLKTLRKVEND